MTEAIRRIAPVSHEFRKDGGAMETLTVSLDARRKGLKMPLDALVRRSRVPRAVVVRILRGNADAVRFGQFQKVAGLLGMPYGSPPVDPEEVRRAEARKKARLLRRLTQGTMALESQALPEDVLGELEERTVARLLAGTGRKLWSD